MNLIHFKSLSDERGSLLAIEGNKDVPFDIKRVYYIYGTKPNVRRGLHAHINLRQVAICIAGSCTILLDDGSTKQEVALNSPMTGLVIEELVWREIYDFSEDCILMVLANNHYDEKDYIRQYDNFLELANEK